jgi:hypothetical protein
MGDINPDAFGAAMGGENQHVLDFASRVDLRQRHSTNINSARPGAVLGRYFNGGVPCASIAISTTSPAFEITCKRRKSFPSESHVKRGQRFVHGDVELLEKLGRNDPCPCGSGRRFQGLLHEIGSFDGANRGHYF